ncbi:hypothetical protein A2853_01435 [Candidatus Kaiserbacteria bacterium RIFCSPHIGHO2_01_FULL_55_17]|uniref:Uncharacterized protein n=1 Tax=Candidatus Kaiserbacteria bacterium RIFCSPHIGHO2_01_FULL_55_17 TaxID=1798484 RepID=A0A1F6D9Z3_9BACT|nr:MAG: hypothetical protein A2853_01435 [Candidatus Kaiserbacteria bacterium RIFCSPHIGHO2_01_FULL_55_17]
MSLSPHAKILLTVVAAIAATLVLTVCFSLYRIWPQALSGISIGSGSQERASQDKATLLEQITPAPVSSATVSQYSKVLKAMSASSGAGGASMSEQEKLDMLAQMQSN